MDRRRLTAQQQLDVIRDVKLGMSRAMAMKKYGIRWHSTLSQIISRRGHQVKVVRTALATTQSSNAAAAVLQKAVRNGSKTQTIRCFIRKPSVPQISNVANGSVMAPDPHAGRESTDDKSQLSKKTTAVTNGQSQQLPYVKIRPIKLPYGRMRAFRKATGHMTIEEKIDEALSRISKLNQKLMIRQGTSVICTCCNREVNFKYNTVIARVREHSITRGHTLSISRTREARQQDRTKESVNGILETVESEPAFVEPVQFPVRRRRRGPNMKPQTTTTRMVRRRAAAATTPVPVVATEEQNAKRQQEFERDLVQTFLETGVPVHKLNMYPMRDLFKKWTGMKVPRYEEKQLDYGF